MKRYWFKRKTYGWGWTPASWEGWLSLIIWAVAFAAIFMTVDENSLSNTQIVYKLVLPAIVISAILCAICWIKGESPRWQWGNTKK